MAKTSQAEGQPYKGYYNNKSQGQPYHGYYSGFNKSASAQIHHLARSLTQGVQSHYDDTYTTATMHPNGINPISDKTDPTLDPESLRSVRKDGCRICGNYIRVTLNITSQVN